MSQQLSVELSCVFAFNKLKERFDLATKKFIAGNIIQVLAESC